MEVTAEGLTVSLVRPLPSFDAEVTKIDYLVSIRGKGSCHVSLSEMERIARHVLAQKDER
jgi:hypothetical protein